MITYLITGANRGIGLELARQAKADGHTVIATARDSGNAKELNATGAEVHQLDVTSDDSVAALGAAVGDRPIDILINNAGVFLDNDVMSFRDLDPQQLADSFSVNAIGAFRVTKALAPAIVRSERKIMIHITSTMGSLARAKSGLPFLRGHLAYRSSKAALNMLSIMMSNELEDEGVTTIAMHPGWVQTDMGGPDAELTAEDAAGRILATIDTLSVDKTADYLDLDGNRLPW